MRRILAILLFALPALATPAQAQVNIIWQTVGNAGNSCQNFLGVGCFGAVSVVYRISRYEITNAQYAAFLNAVAATDPNALYNTHMADAVVPFIGGGGITRSGASGSHSYNTIPGRENLPVNYVTFWDALRFANWLHNGQPTGAQDNTTTEGGAYTITAQSIANNSIVRDAGAQAFIPNENEWFKAAYYKFGGLNAGYWPYPVRQNNSTVCSLPGAVTNRANCGDAVGDLAPVGSYTTSNSASGTYDQGGNAWEWNQTPVTAVSRGVRGGGFAGLQILLGGDVRGNGGPNSDGVSLGFRVAAPAPPTKLDAPKLPAAVPAVGPLGLLVAAVGLIAALGVRRNRS